MNWRQSVLSLALLMIAITACTPAMCGGYQGGVKITRIYTNTTTGVVSIMTNGTSSGAPSCMNTAWPFAYQGGPSNGSAASTTALLISAMVTGTTVRLDGTGTCNTSAGSEDMLDVYYNN